MKTLVLACSLVCLILSAGYAQTYPDLPGPEFGAETELLAPDKITAGLEIRRVDDIHDYGPALFQDDPDLDGIVFYSGSFEESLELALTMRAGISESIELSGSLGYRLYSPWGFEYANGEFMMHVYAQDPSFDMLEATVGARIRISKGEGLVPDITLASGLTYRNLVSRVSSPLLLGNTTRIFMKSRINDIGDLRYSLGLNTLMHYAPAWEGSQGRGESSLEWRLVPSYTVAFLLKLDEWAYVGPEILGEHIGPVLPDGFGPSLGLRHWFGMGLRITESGLPDLMLAGRARTSFDTWTYQALLALSFEI